MADAGWGRGGGMELDTGLGQLLLAHGTQGGQLFGARRWAENPLTLTNVRWQSPAGATLDAVRRPGADDSLTEAEREAWVQLALHFPPMPAGGPQAGASWLPLNVDPAQAAALAQAIRRGLAERRMSGPRGAYVSSWPPPGGPPYTPSSDSPPPWRVARGAGAEPGGAVRSDVPPSPSHYSSGAQGWSGQERSGSGASEGAALLPSVEVALPPASGAGAANYRSDFTREVALIFSRAIGRLPQVREMRGWIRGERIVLAARVVVAGGPRQPDYAEMESITQLVADALAPHTLPLAWIGFADPGEWSQGAALPV
jgi:hypothetical protein